MNFLAHLYLSKDNKNVLLGNFIADAVKGKKHSKYAHDIQAGILLHRAIDTFTDTHPIVKRSMHRLDARYKHYDGVIIDILYDHFLAKNWSNYSEIPLDIYADSAYQFLLSKKNDLPEKIQYMLPFMVKHNWLVAYASIEGISRVLSGMNLRTGGISMMDQAVNDLKKHYDSFEKDFREFFEELQQFSNDRLNQLLKQ